jgi:hypothetical protein
MRHFLFGGVAVAAFFGLMAGAPASAQGACGPGHPCAGARPIHPGVVQGHYDHRYGSRGYGRNEVGVGIAAGVAGLAAGAILGGAIDQNYGYNNNGYYPANSYPADPDDYATGPDQGPLYAAPGPQVADEGDAVAYCERTFRSYDPASGTYLGYDGMRHSCP